MAQKHFPKIFSDTINTTKGTKRSIQQLFCMTKEHILQEIRRTAEANDGVALGEAKFLRETGIKRSDWMGKHWARWNDAVREAGCEPSQWVLAMDENEIIENFIPLVREFGRFPVPAELKLKRQINKNFPTPSLLHDRFKSKRQLAAKVRDYCESKGGYQDIIAICNKIIDIDRKNPKQEQEKAREPSENFGFVYLIKSGKYYTIGCSNSTGRRIYEHTRTFAEKPILIHEIRTDDPFGIEKYWHTRFEDKRKNGDWFDLATEDVDAFKRRKFM